MSHNRQYPTYMPNRRSFLTSTALIGGAMLAGMRPSHGQSAVPLLKVDTRTIEVNKKAVNSIADVQYALSSSGDKPVLLLISRRGQTIYLTVKPD